jgi:hypothetical protein
VLAMTSGSCKGTVTCRGCDSSSFFINCEAVDVPSLPLLQYFCTAARAESVDKLCELCDVKDEVSGNESSSFPPDVVGNTAGGNVTLSRPTVPTEKQSYNRILSIL